MYTTSFISISFLVCYLNQVDLALSLPVLIYLCFLKLCLFPSCTFQSFFFLLLSQPTLAKM